MPEHAGLNLEDTMAQPKPLDTNTANLVVISRALPRLVHTSLPTGESDPGRLARVTTDRADTIRPGDTLVFEDEDPRFGVDEDGDDGTPAALLHRGQVIVACTYLNPQGEPRGTDLVFQPDEMVTRILADL